MNAFDDALTAMQDLVDNATAPLLAQHVWRAGNVIAGFCETDQGSPLYLPALRMLKKAVTEGRMTSAGLDKRVRQYIPKEIKN